jgi:hypothetical protein
VCAKEFCIVYWSWENVGKEPGQPDAAGDIVVNGERYHRAGEQDELSEQVAKDRLGATWMYEDVNPHDSTKSLDVYLVPEGAQPEAGRTRTRSPEIFVVARPQYAAPQYTRSAHALGHVTWKVGIRLWRTGSDADPEPRNFRRWVGRGPGAQKFSSLPDPIRRTPIHA